MYLTKYIQRKLVKWDPVRSLDSSTGTDLYMQIKYLLVFNYYIVDIL